jgi:branched-chain amino acid transport system permease protein
MRSLSHAERLVPVVALVLLALVPPLSLLFGQPFYIDLFTRITIFAIAALSLDLILGYGGMVSFSHAAYLGVGAYAVGIASFYGITNGFAHFAIAAAASALVAAFIGLVSLRTSGVYFLMITLAFGQMLYFLAISLNKYGGDDGLNITAHSTFAGLINLDDPTSLYYFAYGFLLAFLWLCARIVRSRFGMALRGVKSNERRMAAIGFPTFRYRLAAFVISGTMCGCAGVLFANQSLFVSPAIMHWSRSGEILMMVLMGGMGTLLGPILGAVVYLVLEDTLSTVTVYWQLLLGPILIFIVLFAHRGILGIIARPRRRSVADG